jgi:hypothetical protein
LAHEIGAASRCGLFGQLDAAVIFSVFTQPDLLEEG